MNLLFLLTLFELLFFLVQSIDSKDPETSFGSSINSNVQEILFLSTQQVRSEIRPNELDMPKQKLLSGQGTKSFDRLLPSRDNNQIQGNIMYVNQIQIGIPNEVHIEFIPSTTDYELYMNITNVCTYNPHTSYCEQDSNPTENYLEAPIIEKMTNMGGDRYKGTYTIDHTRTGDVSVSIYQKKNGVRGLCYEDAESSGPFVDVVRGGQMSFNWEEGLCDEGLKVGSLMFKGKISFPRDGNHQLKVCSNGHYRFILVGHDEEISSESDINTNSYELSAREYDFILYIKSENLDVHLSLYWHLSSSRQMVLIPEENLFYVEFDWVSEPIHVTCFAGYYLNVTAKSCLECPEGTYNIQDGLTECTSCGPGTFNKERKATMCEECPEMTYGDDSGLTKCTPCPPNSFAHNKASTACYTCDPLCFECFGPYNTQCNSCVKSTGASFIPPNTCQCSDGTYYDPYFDKCTSCHPLCSNCIGPSSTECKGCNTYIAYEIKDLSSLSSLCLTECPERYYSDFFTCKCTFLFLT